MKRGKSGKEENPAREKNRSFKGRFLFGFWFADVVFGTCEDVFRVFRNTVRKETKFCSATRLTRYDKPECTGKENNIIKSGGKVARESGVATVEGGTAGDAAKVARGRRDLVVPGRGNLH